MTCAHSYLFIFQNENLFELENIFNDHFSKRKENFKHMIYKWIFLMIDIIIINYLPYFKLLFD
jgi:hypothetical protein